LSIIIFYDPKIKEVFSLGSNAKTDGRFMVEPIWNVAEQQGVRTAAFYYLSGSDTGALVYLKRMMLQYLIVPGSTVIEWLKLPEKERPHLITLF
jgi:alkaline phosphatase D